MSMRLVDRAGTAIAGHTSRRGFLTKTALAGSALATVPTAYVLKPGTAYAALCRCNNQDCDCGSTCCDGYTEFCCTLTGENSCPTDTVPAGWWKVDGSSFCTASGAPGPRYYLDCNAIPAGPCGPGGVTRLTDQCDCTCADGSCGNRKACCTAFRYGQCNQQISCLGPIVCRVVTCTPPWRFDPTCTTATATDNNTRWHNRPCLERPTPARGALPATFHNGSWTLAYSVGNEGEVETVNFGFGQPGDIPVMGDWNGDGTWTVGVVRGNEWILRNENSSGPADYNFRFGNPGDIPVVGDWNGNGTFGIGMREADSRRWHLRETASAGEPDRSFWFGRKTDLPVVGDWNGDGVTGIGIIRQGARFRRPSTRWLLRNRATKGSPQLRHWWGSYRPTYVVGDWNLNGKTQLGMVRAGGKWQFRGGPVRNITFGHPDAIPLTWQAAEWTPGRLPT
ncbi:MAG: twin-arginine translocation signal domain-containing protein [Acidimicrobiia bacterium]|nr:twin-arginine translocation signal domain-containing protein [Acidimicrobiia bacterium]